MDREELLGEIRTRLLAVHGRRLHGVVLYGSEARGEARPDSDIDVLVLLERPIDYARDLRANIAALYDLVLALERSIRSAPSRWTSTPMRPRRTRCIAVPRPKASVHDR